MSGSNAPVGATGRMSTQSLETGVSSLCRATGCESPELLITGVILLAVVLVTTGVTLVRLRDAREAVVAERCRAVAERDAFGQFRRRVARLETSPAPVGESSTRGSLATTGGPARTATPDARGAAGAAGPPPDSSASDDGLRAVQTAYEETVLSTPHHDSEYGETTTESMAAEFSGAVATTVADGSTLTPPLQTTLLRAADAAADRRAEVLSRLDTEDGRLQEATDVLEPATEAAAVRVDEADVSDCVAAADRLDWHESAVTDLTRERQREVHAHESDHPHWFGYIYDDLDSSHPILATATETLAAVADARDRLARTVADS